MRYVRLDVANNPENETFRVAVTDITDRKLAEDALQASEQKFHSLYAAMTEGVALHEMVFDAKGNPVDYVLLDVNPVFESILRRNRQTVVGRRASEVYGVNPAPYLSKYAEVVTTGHATTFEVEFEPTGKAFSISVFSPAKNQFATLFVDITTERQHQQQLQHIAHFDALTDLPNRVLLADRLLHAMAQVLRRGQKLAVAYLDLDGFKSINDLHGHDIGDQLLIKLAITMKQALREGDTLARLGGDEFVAVMSDLDNIEASIPMLTRLLNAASAPVTIGHLTVQVSASIGVSFYPQLQEVDADQLLRQADQSMYQAKLAGRNRYHIFDPEQDEHVHSHHEDLEQIRQGLSQGEFDLYYQPQVNMRTGQVVGAEALIRWQHPERGLLLPADFLPVIEDHPLVVELGEWVIDRVLAQMERWNAIGMIFPVSVNIGARQLQDANFIERLRALLASHPQIKPSRLELEVRETSALQDVILVSMVISACREIGVTFALDDFGTGYSSLTYLKRIPAEVLKIDQSFVHDMLDDPEALAILAGVLGLATAFRREPVAEGVENVETGVMLRHMGCELAQGYGIARPMPAKEFPDWLASWQPDPRWAAATAIPPGQLPLLYAIVEHRAWVFSIEAVLQGQHLAPPTLDIHLCRFGVWLDAKRLTERGTHPSFLIIDRLHQRLHTLADELLSLHEQGETANALSRINELHALRDELLEQLQVLIESEKYH